MKKLHIFGDHVRFDYFFLIALFINMKNEIYYTILLFSAGLNKICCTKLDLLQDIRKFV